MGSSLGEEISAREDEISAFGGEDIYNDGCDIFMWVDCHWIEYSDDGDFYDVWFHLPGGGVVEARLTLGLLLEYLERWRWAKRRVIGSYG